MPVSVVVPAYNQGKFLAETIESILSQDSLRELIVIDDGSTDDTPALLDRYRDRIVLHRQDNAGEQRAVNKGISLASGEFVAVVNSDDPLLPCALSKCVKALQFDPTLVLAYPNWLEIGPTGETLREVPLPKYDLVSLILYGASLGPGVVVRKSFIDRVGGRNESLRYAGDIDLLFRLASQGPFHHVPEFLATHRVHPAAASSRGNGLAIAREVEKILTPYVSIAPAGVGRMMGKLRFSMYFSCARHAGIPTKAGLHYLARALYQSPTRFSRLALGKIARLILGRDARAKVKRVFGLS